MTPFEENDLKQEIQHIFDSGANEIRVYEMVKRFFYRLNEELPSPEEVQDYTNLINDNDFQPKDQLTTLQFIAEAKKTLSEMLRIYQDCWIDGDNEKYLDQDRYCDEMCERFFFGGDLEFFRLLNCEIITDDGDKQIQDCMNGMDSIQRTYIWDQVIQSYLSYSLGLVLRGGESLLFISSRFHAKPFPPP